MTDRNLILNNLKNGVCVVQFEKQNGDMRTLYATLDTNLIPTDKLPKSDEVVNEERIACFDVEAGEYRSFYPNKVVTHTGPMKTLADARKAWEAYNANRM